MNLSAMINTFNQQLFLFINHAAGHFVVLDYFFLFVTRAVVPAIVCLSLYWFFVVLPRKLPEGKERLRRFGDGMVFVLSLGILWCIVEIIKGVVAFPRPQQLLTGVHVLSTFGSYDSFPSAHTAFAFAVATFVYHYSRGTGLLLFFIAVLVGVSRIFVGVHFPLDVLVGATLGVLVPLGVLWFSKRYTF